MYNLVISYIIICIVDNANLITTQHLRDRVLIYLSKINHDTSNDS